MPLYEKGLSLREIERQTGFAKTSIREALISVGLPLRKKRVAYLTPLKRPKGMQAGTLPYGYTYLEGLPVYEPKEYKIVLIIYKQWLSGTSYRDIACALNKQGLFTRAGKKWTHEIIKRIIDRHETDLNIKNKEKKKWIN